MINRRLTSKEAADRLGVKPATLYSYVSRGLLEPEKGGRESTFDAQQVARLARTARHPRSGKRARGEESGAEPVFVTAISTIDTGHLYYRGRDAVDLSRSWSFEVAAAWLWTGRADSPEIDWQVLPEAAAGLREALHQVPAGAAPLERFMVAVVASSLNDGLRHDLNPAGVPVTARALVAAMAASLPRYAGGSVPSGPMSRRVWSGLCDSWPTEPEMAVVDAALVLALDHELAPSTLAARVAASFRADPYAVVLTGLGPASGSWPSGSTGAPSEVEALLDEAAQLGAERAVGERLRRLGATPHGFGMPLYPDGDPRAAELLSRLPELDRRGRWEVVERVLDVASERGFPQPNFDLGLGALSFCAGMPRGSGQAISTLAKAAGWLAHAMEEYVEPTRFRARADYVGEGPDDATSASVSPRPSSL